ncbi:hypothetical protein HK103_005956 [Boothiomyces macroporosus]|uniref:Uncharacterized protein n=1 Tax=Boothiomyces macroporosus TaxID=261099 RepID=A0AAD5UQ19_9FUNG|nr:hypothetical protein HK103_005956 [Boothiomyces macroporosus]
MSEDEFIEGFTDSLKPIESRPSSSKRPTSAGTRLSTLSRKHSSASSSSSRKLRASRTSFRSVDEEIEKPVAIEEPEKEIIAQPSSFYGVRYSTENRDEPRQSRPIKAAPVPYQEDASSYIEQNVLPTLLPVIEELLRLVKYGESPQNPILFLAKRLGSQKAVVDPSDVNDESVQDKIIEI